jgi:hypothetical protein
MVPAPATARAWRGSRWLSGEHFGEEFDELVEESDFEEEPRTLAEIDLSALRWVLGSEFLDT